MIDREAWHAAVMGSQRVGHDWATELNATAMGHFSIRLWHVMKSGFYTTSNDQLSGWTEKKLQSISESQTCTKKRSWSLFGGLLLSDPLELSEFQQNHYIWEVCSANQWYALKTATPAAGTGQQKAPDSAPRQRPTTCHTTSASKVQRIGQQSFASSTTFTWPHSTDYHFFKHLNNFWQGKCFHNQRQAENAFQEFVEFQITDFYAIGMNTFISCWQKCVDCTTEKCVDSYFD